jgi:hypothetical protein
MLRQETQEGNIACVSVLLRAVASGDLAKDDWVCQCGGPW